eukprot:scaffold1023_cov313-Pinguiococcus_pyrenoidosus.AAC.18
MSAEGWRMEMAKAEAAEKAFPYVWRLQKLEACFCPTRRRAKNWEFTRAFSSRRRAKLAVSERKQSPLMSRS